MHPDLYKRRSFLVLARARYEEADADWRRALREAAQLVPVARRRNCWSIGNPGSQVRKLYDRRDRSIQMLAVARIKLGIARERLNTGTQPRRQSTLYFLPKEG